MTEAFYDKALSLFFGFSLLLIFVFTTAQLLMLYIIFQNSIFYTGYLTTLASSSIYGVIYYARFRELHDSLSLLIPDPQRNEPLEPLDIDVEDRPLKVCLYYRNGASLTHISKNMNLEHPNQAKRELVKGLGFLLKFYNEHKQEDIKT